MSDQEDALPAEVDRVWHALKRRGWHPGRTDDTLSACVRAVIDAAPIGPYNRGVDAVIKRQEDALPALPEPYWPGFRPSLDSRVDLFTADQMHSYARAALAARDDAQGDQVADVAIALEQQRALKIVADVAALRSDKDMTEAFDAGFVTACDEIEHRLRTERWALGGVDGPLPAARDDARDAEIARLREALREGERLVRLRWNVQNKEYHLQCKGWLAALWEEKA